MFGQTLATLRVRHLRTQINSPWINGKIERVWGTLQAEVLDRQVLSTPEAADAELAGWAAYYNYHRLHGEIGCRTAAGTQALNPFSRKAATEPTEHDPAELARLLEAWNPVPLPSSAWAASWSSCG